MATATKKKPKAKKAAQAKKAKATKPVPETNGHLEPKVATDFPKDRAGTPAKKCPRCEKDVSLDLDKCECGHSFTDQPSDPDPAEDARFRAKIEEMEAGCRQAEEEWQRSKEETKELKDVFEGKVTELRKYIRGQNESLPLFEGKNGQTSVAAVGPTDEAWRGDPIDVLSDEAVVGDKAVSEALLAHFRKEQILTIGDLVNYTDPTKNGGYERRVTDINGIGKVAAEKVSEATIAYWAYRAEHAPPSPAAEAAPPETNPAPGETIPASSETPAGELTYEDEHERDEAEE